MKIMVTGSDGFIGSHLVQALEMTGIHDVIKVPKYIEYPKEFMCSTRPDLVIHLGAISNTLETDHVKLAEYNYWNSIKYFNACQDLKIPMQYASSAAVYGNESRITCETDNTAPASLYALTKSMFDKYVLGMIDLGAVISPIQGFRYYNVFGNRESKKGKMASPYTQFHIQANELREITLFKKSKKYLRDFVWVGDVVATHLDFIRFNIQESGIWNVGSGTVASFRQVADTIAAKYDYFTVDKVKLKKIDMPTKMKLQYQKYTCANNDKLNETLAACQPGYKINWKYILDYIEEYEFEY